MLWPGILARTLDPGEPKAATKCHGLIRLQDPCQKVGNTTSSHFNQVFCSVCLFVCFQFSISGPTALSPFIFSPLDFGRKGKNKKYKKKEKIQPLLANTLTSPCYY